MKISGRSLFGAEQTAFWWLRWGLTPRAPVFTGTKCHFVLILMKTLKWCYDVNLKVISKTFWSSVHKGCEQTMAYLLFKTKIEFSGVLHVFSEVSISKSEKSTGTFTHSGFQLKKFTLDPWPKIQNSYPAHERLR